MGSFSIWHWLVVLLVVLLLFGSGKISGLMGDLAKGIKSFKQNMKEEEPDASMAQPNQPPSTPSGSIPGPTAAQTPPPSATPVAPPHQTNTSNTPRPAA